jgi:transcription elongation factor GreB
MSKAFTKEDDDAVEEMFPLRPALPPGAVNYLTPEGERLLRKKLAWLAEEERPPLLAAKEDETARRRLRQVEAQMRDLAQRLEEAVVMPPPVGRREVNFGATVTVRDQSGVEFEYRIVGVNEAELEECWISAASPLARLLMGRRTGDRVVLRGAVEERRLQILAVAY